MTDLSFIVDRWSERNQCLLFLNSDKFTFEFSSVCYCPLCQEKCNLTATFMGNNISSNKMEILSHPVMLCLGCSSCSFTILNLPAGVANKASIEVIAEALKTPHEVAQSLIKSRDTQEKTLYCKIAGKHALANVGSKKICTMCGEWHV